ncbi:MAG TPA: hybrid sensor histidine kinase/response regulator [Bacteroidia bacterium]|jgi:signal transduction histidine kinase|nr:hybrid sensor histidine kinase/response regulator [Bacteroidia bacterium]
MYKILFLEDNNYDVELIQRELKTSGIKYLQYHVFDKKGFLTGLSDFKPDIVLADYSLPSFNGMEAFSLLKQNKLRPAFIIVTGALSEQMAFDCLVAGIDDFVLKSNYKRLPTSVIKALEKRKAEVQRDKMAMDIIKRNEELEQFAYIISHNLRGSVASLQGLFNIWDPEERAKHEQKYIYEGIKASIQKMDEVIKDINFILKVKNAVNENKETVKLMNMVKDIKLGIYTSILAEKVKIKCDFDQAESVFSIKSYMHSIFYNLISNSIKYRKADEPPLIHISSRLTDANIEIIFKDNGIGIDLNKHKDKIFGLYKRFNNEKEGKGMGLFLVKTQVESMGGAIEVKSNLGEGTSFIIKLPVADLDN